VGNSLKIAISLPRETLGELERLRRATGESRSAILRRAIENLGRERDREAKCKRYVEGYARQPEGAAEVAAAEAAAARLLSQEPW